MRPAEKRGEFTWRNYQGWPQGERWQLLDGHAHAMAPPNVAHQTVVFEFGRQLGNQLLGQPCRAFAGPIGVRLPQDDEADSEVRTVFEPDLVVVCDPRKIDAKGIRGAPDFVVEVLSPSTASFDQIEKRAAYERAGVCELWLVDVAGGVITRFLRGAEGFAAPSFHRAQGSLAIVALPGLALDLDFMPALKAKEPDWDEV